jgi:hypothetical protein
MDIERALKELLGEDITVSDPEPSDVPPDPIEDLPHLEPLDLDLEEEDLPMAWSPVPPGVPPLKSAWRSSSSFRVVR